MAGFIRRAQRTVYANPWLRFEAHEIVHPNGSVGEHGLVVTPPASAAVVLDGDDVWLARQARFAVDAVVLEVVKGGADAGESPLACARRETREEIGVEARRWESLGITYEIPSIVAEPVSLFLARDLQYVATDPEHVESIAAVRVPFADALAMCADGRIDDAVTAVALFRASHHLQLMLCR